MGSALALLALAVGSPFAGGPTPSTVPDSFRARVQTPYAVESIAWQGPESFAARRSAQDGGDVVELGGTTWYSMAPGYPGEILRRTFGARPDGFSQTDALASVTGFVLAQARAGKRKLASTKLAGRPALRARVPLHPNDCAALRRGTAEVWLDRETLLPLRLTERRARTAPRTWTYVYRDVNSALPASAFARPRLGKKPFRQDFGFVRTAPAHAAGPISYTPLLPTALPPGFELAVSGWARKSGRTGAEASNPEYRDLFGAVYRRGFERVDVSQRLAGKTGWPSDPFGAECAFEFVEKARVKGVEATYGASPEISPHLYWRQGKLLFTVSGPFPKADLVAIAESLTPVGS